MLKGGQKCSVRLTGLFEDQGGWWNLTEDGQTATSSRPRIKSVYIMHVIYIKYYWEDGHRCIHSGKLERSPDENCWKRGMGGTRGELIMMMSGKNLATTGWMDCIIQLHFSIGIVTGRRAMISVTKKHRALRRAPKCTYLIMLLNRTALFHPFSFFLSYHSAALQWNGVGAYHKSSGLSSAGACEKSDVCIVHTPACDSNVC